MSEKLGVMQNFELISIYAECLWDYTMQRNRLQVERTDEKVRVFAHN